MNIIKQSFRIADPIDGEAILKKIEECARVSHKSKSTENSAAEFVQKLISWGHLSVLEHHSITVEVTTNRAILQELLRHRHLSPTMESTRYCAYKDYIEVIDNEEINSYVNKHIWINTINDIEDRYLELLDNGVAPEDARGVLPLDLAAKCYITANLRTWREVFQKRTVDAAHHQIRDLIGSIHEEFKRQIPVIFDNLMNPELERVLFLLRDLAGLQNGAPLIRYEKEYNDVMEKVEQMLMKYDL